MVSPAIQLNVANINQDFEIMSRILSASLDCSKLYLATPYFNLPAEYENLMVDLKPGSFEILTASPQANGFYGSLGISRHVPAAYSYLEKLFLKKMSSKNHNDCLREYQRAGWTWHGKGIWLNSAEYNLTSIGSSNLNYRSLYRDFEVQLYLVTNNRDLKIKIDSNRTELFSHSFPVDLQSLSRRQIPNSVKFLTKLLKTMF